MQNPMHNGDVMMSFKVLANRFINDQSGATAIEYGLIASLIAVAIIGAATTLGTKLGTTFASVSDQLK